MFTYDWSQKLEQMLAGMEEGRARDLRAFLEDVMPNARQCSFCQRWGPVERDVQQFETILDPDSVWNCCLDCRIVCLRCHAHGVCPAPRRGMRWRPEEEPDCIDCVSMQNVPCQLGPDECELCAAQADEAAEEKEAALDLERSVKAARRESPPTTD